MRYRLIVAALLFSMFSSVTACSTSDTTFDPPEALLGRWQAHGGDGRLLAEQTYNADGTAVILDAPGRDRREVTYVADEREITLDGSGPDDVLTQRFTYFAGDDRFAAWALLPEGETDGAVGTWHGEWQDTSERGTESHDARLTVRADGTASHVHVVDEPGGHTSRYVLDGRWKIVGDKLTLVGPRGKAGRTWDYIPDQVIGVRVFVRADD